MLNFETRSLDPFTGSQDKHKIFANALARGHSKPAPSTTRHDYWSLKGHSEYRLFSDSIGYYNNKSEAGPKPLDFCKIRLRIRNPRGKSVSEHF